VDYIHLRPLLFKSELKTTLLATALWNRNERAANDILADGVSLKAALNYLPIDLNLIGWCLISASSTFPLSPRAETRRLRWQDEITKTKD
jgi:hypothetical protein